MGVNQHHDGISGTATSVAANDYAARLYQGIIDSKNASADIIDEQLSYFTGVSAEKWNSCLVQNDTYLDCPIANNTNSTWLVRVFNPALVSSLQPPTIKVPHGNYNVQQWNYNTS
jgi:hypothetical protein